MNGNAGHCPAWYLTMKAAKFMGVAPWELEEQSIMWRQRALMMQSVEAHVEAQNTRKGR